LSAPNIGGFTGNLAVTSVNILIKVDTACFIFARSLMDETVHHRLCNSGEPSSSAICLIFATGSYLYCVDCVWSRSRTTRDAITLYNTWLDSGTCDCTIWRLGETKRSLDHTARLMEEKRGGRTQTHPTASCGA
jgi:hypothetical protein